MARTLFYEDIPLYDELCLNLWTPEGRLVSGYLQPRAHPSKIFDLTIRLNGEKISLPLDTLQAMIRGLQERANDRRTDQ